MLEISWRNKGVALVVLLIFLSFLTGCWDRLEIEERANVLGIAIDAIPSQDLEKNRQKESNVAHTKSFEQASSDMLRITVQLAVPGRLPLGTGSNSGEGAGGRESVWVIDSVGHSLDDAYQNLQQQLSQRLSLGHLRIIVLQEGVAREGVDNINDFLRRHTDVRRAAWMLVSKDEASKIMYTAPELERIPIQYLLNTMDTSVQIGKYPEEYLGIFWSKISSKGQEAFLPYVTIQEDDNIEISGLAYFKDFQMVGTTEPLEIGFYMAIMHINPGGYSGLYYLPEYDSSVMFNAKNRKSRIKVEIQNDLPHVFIHVHLEGEIREITGGDIDISDPADIVAVEELITEKAGEAFHIFINKTKEKQSDIFGFGEYVRGKHSKYWNEKVKTKKKWQELYQNISIDIHVSVDIRRIGMKAE